MYVEQIGQLEKPQWADRAVAGTGEVQRDLLDRPVSDRQEHVCSPRAQEADPLEVDDQMLRPGRQLLGAATQQPWAR